MTPLEIQAAIYARVSSDQQSQAATIDSQVADLCARAKQDQAHLDQTHHYLDDGYSGATLVRPALERLRDAAYMGAIDRLYVHSPDRLARKYAYQVLLVEELERANVEVVFLNYPIGGSPEESLLLQMQGMIAEYERAKILERSRRGKRHAAKRGDVSVLSGAPYGYCYIPKSSTGTEASYQIILEQARIVQQIFGWVGQEGLSMGAVRRRLHERGVKTLTGKAWWDRTTIWGMLKNPAYKGLAGFGKTHVEKRKPQLRPQRGQAEQPRKNYSTCASPPEDQTSIPVPALIGEELFDAVQERLVENKKRNREGRRGVKYLLQGLLQCQCCGYAYYGKKISPAGSKGKKRPYAYYRCIGSDAYRFGGERICYNKQVRTDLLEEAVWEDVRSLLKEPSRLSEEFERRQTNKDETQQASEKQLRQTQQKIKRAMARLLDAYEDGLIEKGDFEPRMRRHQERLAALETERRSLAEAEAKALELRLAVGCLEDFAEQIAEGLNKPDWTTKREIIRALVKRVEIGEHEIQVVYRISSHPFVPSPDRGILQDCWWGDLATLGEYRSQLPRLAT